MQNEDEKPIDKLNKMVEARNSIVHYPDKGLTFKCEPVKEASWNEEGLFQYIRKMTSVMMALDGCGIAGPQIGFNYKVCICWLNERAPEDVLVMINPEVVYVGGDWVDKEEGCLSLPKVRGNVRRRNTILVKYKDMEGFEYEDTFTGWNARVVQHELDHLNGSLIFKRFNPATYAANRKHLEYMELRVNQLPERLRRKGKALKNERI